jgi:hypothetical protein
MISRIFFVGSPPGMASAPLRRSTNTSLPKTPFNFRNRDLGAFFPKLTTSLDERGKAGIFHPSSKHSHGGLSVKLLPLQREPLGIQLT